MSYWHIWSFESSNKYGEWKIPLPKDYTLYNSIYMACEEWNDIEITDPSLSVVLEVSASECSYKGDDTDLYGGGAVLCLVCICVSILVPMLHYI